MRVAFVGKGGSGKSVLSGMLARVLGRQGQRVLALDVDTMPGLAFSLGIPLREAGLPEELGERQEGRGWVVRDGVTAEKLVERYAVCAPDGVCFLQLGKLPSGVKPGSTTAFRHVLENFRSDGWSLVGDLAAGTRQPFFGWADFAQVIAVVVEPSAKSLLSARRLAGLVGAVDRTIVCMVANKVRDRDDLRLIAQGASLPLIGVVPFDEDLAAADRAGRAPLDVTPASPAVTAAEGLAASLEQIVANGGSP